MKNKKKSAARECHGADKRILLFLAKLSIKKVTHVSIVV